MLSLKKTLKGTENEETCFFLSPPVCSSVQRRRLLIDQTSKASPVSQLACSQFPISTYELPLLQKKKKNEENLNVTARKMALWTLKCAIEETYNMVMHTVVGRLER